MKIFRVILLSLVLLFTPVGCSTPTEKFEQAKQEQVVLNNNNTTNLQMAAEGTAQALNAVENPSAEVEVAKQFNGVVQAIAGIPDPKIRATVTEMVNGMIARDAAQLKKFKEFESSAKENKTKLDEVNAKLDKMLDIVVNQSKELEAIKAASFWSKIKRWTFGILGVTFGSVVLYAIIAAGGGGLLWALFLKCIRIFPSLAIKFGVASASTLVNVVKGVGTIRQDLKRDIQAGHLDPTARKDAAETLDWMNTTMRGTIKDVHDEKAIDAIRKQHDL
jgi:hypothetical protein